MVLQPVPDGLAMTSARVALNVSGLFASMLLFTLCFVLSFYRVMPHVIRSYALMPLASQADYASRIHSTLHAVVVPFGLVWATSTCSLWGEPLVNTCQEAEFFFSLSVGYFIVDLAIMVAYRTEFWQAFVFHHTIALLPYAINNFVPTCSHSHLLLSLMLMVEFSTIFLNLKWWLEQTEGATLALYSFAFYGMYITWFVVRVLNPIYVVIMMVNVVFPYYGLDRRVLVSYTAAFLVAAFCWYCFFFVFTPELFQRLKRRRSAKPASINLAEDVTYDHRLLIEEESELTPDGEKAGPRGVSRPRSRSGNLDDA